jgi:hypothetical protein
MTFFRADDAEMGALATRLRAVSRMLEEQSRHLVDVGAFGLPEAVDAVSHFVSGWSHGRDEIVGGIRFAQQALSGAGDHYRRTDQAISESL